MKRALALITLSAASVFAQQPPAPTAPAPAAAPAAPYELKNRSSFTLASDTRAPFLPIGYKKTAGTVAAATPAKPAPPPIYSPELRPEHFTVTSISLGQQGQVTLATINNRSFAVGETMPVVFNGQNVTVIVREIRDGQVTLEASQKLIVIPLKRPEAIQRQPGNPAEIKGPGSIIIETQPAKPGARRQP